MRVHESVFVFIMMQTVCTGVVVLSVDGEEREREGEKFITQERK